MEEERKGHEVEGRLWVRGNAGNGKWGQLLGEERIEFAATIYSGTSEPAFQTDTQMISNYSMLWTYRRRDGTLLRPAFLEISCCEVTLSLLSIIRLHVR